MPFVISFPWQEEVGPKFSGNFGNMGLLSPCPTLEDIPKVLPDRRGQKEPHASLHALQHLWELGLMSCHSLSKVRAWCWRRAAAVQQGRGEVMSWEAASSYCSKPSKRAAKCAQRWWPALQQGKAERRHAVTVVGLVGSPVCHLSPSAQVLHFPELRWLPHSLILTYEGITEADAFLQTPAPQHLCL